MHLWRHRCTPSPPLTAGAIAAEDNMVDATEGPLYGRNLLQSCLPFNAFCRCGNGVTDGRSQ